VGKGGTVPMPVGKKNNDNTAASEKGAALGGRIGSPDGKKEGGAKNRKEVFKRGQSQRLFEGLYSFRGREKTSQGNGTVEGPKRGELEDFAMPDQMVSPRAKGSEAKGKTGERTEGVENRRKKGA